MFHYFWVLQIQAGNQFWLIIYEDVRGCDESLQGEGGGILVLLIVGGHLVLVGLEVVGQRQSSRRWQASESLE